MSTQTKQKTLEELYDSLPERAERVSPWERFNPSTGDGESAKKLYEIYLENWTNIRPVGNTIESLVHQEYDFIHAGNTDESTAKDYEYSFKPVHALKYWIKYKMCLYEAISYAKEAKLGKREFKAAIRSLFSDAQKIHDYVEKSNAETDGEGEVTTYNSCLRNTRLMKYHLRENDAHPDRIFEAVYRMQFERHKRKLEHISSLVKEFEELEKY